MKVDLSPNTPDDERRHFNRYFHMYSKLLAVNLLEKENLHIHKQSFDRVVDFIVKKKYDEAHKEMAESLMNLHRLVPLDTVHVQYQNDTENKEWKLIAAQYHNEFIRKLNKITKEYDFHYISYQIQPEQYTALLLVSKK